MLAKLRILSYLLILAPSCYAALQRTTPIQSCLSKSMAMPQYTMLFNLPYQQSYSSNAPQFLVVRFYQAFGNGDSLGWQTPVKPPTVRLNANPLPVSLVFSYASDFYLQGGLGLGYDQYAQYYDAVLPLMYNTDNQLAVTGTYQQVAYMSVTVYRYYADGQQEQIEIVDNQAITLADACNPFTIENPSVFAYSQPNLQQEKMHADFPPARTIPLHTSFVDATTGKVWLFRLDQEDSRADLTDDIAADGCSRDYLFGQMPDHSFAILRIKVPNTFIDSDSPDKKFGFYQTRYLSVSAHYLETSTTPLDFWTVNARMLKKHADNDGYAYVFFAPDSYTSNIVAQQGTPPTQPPVITWGRYTGYLLGEPNYAIIIRYRMPDPHWQGSPENATCYATSADLQPVTKNELGDWLPEVYRGTMDDFLNGRLGRVNQEEAWPKSIEK